MVHTRRRLLASAAAVGVSGVAGCTGTDRSPYTPGADGSTDWPVSGGEPGGSAHVPDAAVPRSAARLRWQIDLPVVPTGQPLVADGRVFVDGWQGTVALDAATGERRWKTTSERTPTAQVVAGDHVYVGFDDGDTHGVRALAASDGSEHWRAETPGHVTVLCRSTDDDPTLYVGDDAGQVTAIEASSGRVRATVSVFGAVSTLVVGRGLFVGTRGGSVLAFTDRGEELRGRWRRSVGGLVADLVAAPGRVYVAAAEGGVSCLADGPAGRTHWHRASGGHRLAVTGEDVVGASGAELTVEAAEAGTDRWQADGPYVAAPAVAGDVLVAAGGRLGAGGDGFVAGYRLRGGLGGTLLGRERWRVETDRAGVHGVTVGTGAVFVATQDVGGPSTLYAVEPA
jgi:outer membrane protein assembly factor BamB